MTTKNLIKYSQGILVVFNRSVGALKQKTRKIIGPLITIVEDYETDKQALIKEKTEAGKLELKPGTDLYSEYDSEIEKMLSVEIDHGVTEKFTYEELDNPANFSKSVIEKTGERIEFQLSNTYIRDLEKLGLVEG